MANDLRVNLRMNSEDFDRNIAKSKKQIQDWRGKMNVASQEIQKGFGVLAGAVLGAQGAAELFNKTINSTQTTGDAYQKMMDEMSGATNLFFSSIAQADFSLFVSGLQSAIREAGKLSVLLDNLGTNKMFSTPELARLDRDIALQNQIVKDNSKDESERTAASAKVKELQAKKRSVKELTVSQSLEAGYQSFRSGLSDVGFNNSGSVTSDEVLKVMENLRTGKAGDIGAKYKQLYDSQTERVQLSKGGYANVKNPARVAEYEAFMKTNEGRWSAMNFFANQAPDDPNSKLGQSVENLAYGISAQTQLIQEETKNIRAANMIGGGKDSSSKTKNGKVSVSVKVETEGAEDVYDISKVDAVMEGIAINQSDKRKNSASQSLLNSDSFKNVEEPFIPKDIEKIDVTDQIGQFATLAGAIGSVTGAVNGGAAGWASWSASLLSAIGTAIPAVAALTAAKEAEAKANGKAAITGAASSVASIPVVGWLMAGAAVASVTAALVNMPKFAAGTAYIPPTISGDQIPALMNAGEMVLNERQQTRLFNQLNSRERFDGSSGGSVEFKIKGDYLVGLLNKTNKRNNSI